MLNARTVPLAFDKRLQFRSNVGGGVVAILYSLIIQKVSLEHNLHQKMPLQTVCIEATYASAGFA